VNLAGVTHFRRVTQSGIDPYRALVEQAPTMIWRSGLDARCDYVNTTWLTFTGRALHQELGGGWEEGVHPDDLRPRSALYLDHFERRESFETEYRLRRHDGVYRYVLDRAVPYRDAAGAFAGFLGSCIDVDDRRTRDATHGVDAFFEMSLDLLCVAGFDGYIKRVNPSWSKTLGWTPGEVMSRPSVELVHPEDRQGVLAARGRLVEGTPLRKLTNRYLCKDGTYRWFEWRSVADVDRGLVYAAARDVTEEKAAERVLRDLTQSLTTTLNSIADGVIAIDADAAIARMNPVAESLTGWTSVDARGKQLDHVFNIVDAETRVTAARPVKRTLQEGIAVELAHHTLLIARDGTELPIASSCAPMRNPDGSVSGAVLVFRDMTAEKQAREAHDLLQRQLIFADRMASVGTLAAGAAHEINNPLAYVTANLDMVIEELAELGGAAPSAALLAEWTAMTVEAREGANRIAKIVRGLMSFSRTEQERRVVIDVTPTLELSCRLAFNEITHRARLVKDYGEIPRIEADETQLVQVFINLLVNAAQALPEGHTEANEIRLVTTTDAQGRAVIEVRDTGSGIPESVIGRVFDPFFTTKPIGVGTGLGLSICHNIVTGLGGEITVHRREGGGTTFRVVLPAASTRVDPAPAPASTANGSTGRRTVLIVDDDRAVGTALGRALRDHDVTVVMTAKEALELVVERSFDVILSDLMMPDMSGMDLYDQLVVRCPQAVERMVFITGGAFTPDGIAFLDRVPNQRLEKPFDSAAVRTLIQQFGDYR
jgi:PAS domain S-box-containing protein